MTPNSTLPLTTSETRLFVFRCLSARSAQPKSNENALFELLCKLNLVKKDVGVVVVAVEAVLDLADALHRVLQVVVAAEDDERRVRPVDCERFIQSRLPADGVVHGVCRARACGRRARALELIGEVGKGRRAPVFLVREADDVVEGDL